MNVRTIVFMGLTLFPAALRSAELPAVSEPQLRAGIAAAKRPAERLAASLELAQWYRSNNESAKAAAIYTEVLEGNLRRKDRYAVLVRKGDLYLDGRQYSQAIEAYQEAAQLLPKNDTAHLALARAYEQSELYQLAEQEYLEVLRRNRRSFDATFRLASLYLKEGLHTQAMEYYRRALTIHPDAAVYRCISSCAETSGDLGLALAMRRQIVLQERTYDDYLSMGHLFIESKNYREAEEAFSQAIKLNPDIVEGYVQLSLVYLSQNELTPAEKLLQIAVEKSPEEGFLHFVLGNIYSREQKIPLARSELKRAGEEARTDVLRLYSARLSDFLSH